MSKIKGKAFKNELFIIIMSKKSGAKITLRTKLCKYKKMNEIQRLLQNGKKKIENQIKNYNKFYCFYKKSKS